MRLNEILKEGAEPLLPNVQAIAEYVVRSSDDGMDVQNVMNSLIGDYGPNCKAVLKKLDIAKIDTGDAWDNAPDKSKDLSYAAMPSAGAPPILVSKGYGRYEVLDGHHRRRAAKARGDKFMWAYVIS